MNIYIFYGLSFRIPLLVEFSLLEVYLVSCSRPIAAGTVTAYHELTVTVNEGSLTLLITYIHISVNKKKQIPAFIRSDFDHTITTIALCFSHHEQVLPLSENKE